MWFFIMVIGGIGILGFIVMVIGAFYIETCDSELNEVKDEMIRLHFSGEEYFQGVEYFKKYRKKSYKLKPFPLNKE